MKIVVLGGGPSGIYLAVLMKLKNPAHDITIYERNKRDDSFGWGIVFSDQTVENMRHYDPISAEKIWDHIIHMDDVAVHYKGQMIRSKGHGFIGIGRVHLLQILYDRALALGVDIQFETEFDVEDINTRFSDADVIVVSDGLNSKIRNHDIKAFECDIDVRPNKFIWFGTKQNFGDAFTFIFEETPHGWIWAHAHQFEENCATFIVECGPETHKALGFDKMDHRESARACCKIFEKYLKGHDLMTKPDHVRGSEWLNFPRILCHQWVKNNMVLIGDAAHNAHFTIGSGTKLGLEDAACLAHHLSADQPIDLALKAYQAERMNEALKLQSAARNSMTWFEEIERYVDFDPIQFAYALLTRSQRVGHENLRLRDKDWLENVEKYFATKALGYRVDHPIPPMFTPYKLRDMTLKNRVVVSPMCMYSATHGLINDFHLVHYGALAMGGAGLLFTEMTNISADGRISPGCAGIYTDEQAQAWKRVVDYTHRHSACKIALQIGHAGRKGSTKIGWEGYDMPLEEGSLGGGENWEIIGPSPIKWDGQNQTPREMQGDDFDRVLNNFVSATKNAQAVGFDMIELHAAHGYLLSSFISPLSNIRTDQYGGCLENRLRFPLAVFRAMRAVWPATKPMSVRISASDWVHDHGITPEDSVLIAQAFVAAGVDIIDVSAGQTVPANQAHPIHGRMFQTPLSDRIRNEIRVATMAVGNIYEPDHVNSIIAAGRADLVLLARPHLMDPHWTIRAAAELDYQGDAVLIPKQYEVGYSQMKTNLKRASDMALNA